MREYIPEDISPHQTELATSLRVPFIRNPWPRWFYVTAIFVDPGSPPGWHGELPTDNEVRMVASYNDCYRDYWYCDSYKAKMREFAPYDIDGGAVGRYLVKYPDGGGWAYRKHTWQYGHTFVPASPFLAGVLAEETVAPLTLEQALDHERHIGTDYPDTKWIAWKAAHPEVFALAASDV